MSNNSLKRQPRPLPDGTIEIQLTKGYTTIVDDIDVDLAQYNWSIRSNPAGNKYARGHLNAGDKSIALHRIILERIIGRPLTKNELTDHIDGNGLNNRRSNLRIATHSQNIANSDVWKNNTSGYRGVHWNNKLKKWRVFIFVNKIRHNLGHFEKLEDAHIAYCEASIKYYGEFTHEVNKL